VDIDEIQEELTGKPQPPSNEVKSKRLTEKIEYDQYVTCVINDELFAVDTMKVKEVLKYIPLTPVPGSKEYVSGLINLRGNVVTVIDTRLLFSLSYKSPCEETNIIVIDFSENEMIGFLVDDVDEVVNVAQVHIESAPSFSSDDFKSNFVQGVTYYKNNLLVMLDFDKILLYITPEDDPEIFPTTSTN